MASVDVIVKSTDQGSQNIQRFGDQLQKLGMQAFGVSSAMGAAKKGLDLYVQGIKAGWDAFEGGAAISAMEGRFENLAGSIRTTADALNTQLAEATQGMMSNAQMMSAASDIISLGLADTGDRVVRLGALVGQLGWDMQVLTLTMANDSMLRLDALGLSMENVKRRMEELKAAGMEAGDAFDLAVIEAGEEKVKLLGNAAETTAGKIQQMTVVWENARDAFNQSFAEGLAERFDQVAGSVSAMGVAIEAAAAGAGSVLADIASSRIFTDPTFRWLIERGIKELEEQRIQEAIGGGRAGAAVRNPDDFAGIEQTQEIEAVARALKGLSGDLSVTKGEYAQAAGAAGEFMQAMKGLDDLNVTKGQYAAMVNADAMAEEAEEAAERAQEAAEAMATAYEEAGRRMGQAFSGFVNAPETLPDFGDMAGMDALAWEMASAFGLTVEQAGNLGIALGEIKPEMAEAAAKAVIFQEAFGSLLGQLQAGNLDTSGFVTAYENLIADLNSKSLVEIQVELKQKADPVRNWLDFLPEEDRAAVEVPVTFTPEEAALNTALGVIDGIPDDQTKIITFDAEYGEVTTAISTIEADIGAIDGRVLMTPEATEVYDVITALDKSRIEVFVDFVQGSAPEIPGRAGGGPVTGGEAYWIGERGPEMFVPWTSGNIIPNDQIGGGGMQLTLQNYFYGPTNAAEVARATDTAARRMMERIRQVTSV